MQPLPISADLNSKLILHLEENVKWQADAIGAASQPGRNMYTSTKDLYQVFEKDFPTSLFAELRYTEIDNRYQRISEAFTKTFEWLFRPPTITQNWSSFMDFLEGDQQLYWITGKPGAGKSTLMKFVSQHASTKKHLDYWAGGEPLIIVGFYFWCSGSELQMSEEGFIRTLLLELLQQLPNLCPIAFPDKWETFVLCGKLAWDGKMPLSNFPQALKAVVDEAKKSHKIFFFIDGLDEFKGNQKDQIKLVDLIHSLLDPQVKMCVSSRPWNHFEDAFGTRPRLKIEDLTRPDIEHFVVSKLRENRGFEELRMEQPDYTGALIENVTVKASGVFLWVVLVVDSLLEGFTNGERLIDLQYRLDSLPADLERLFWSILNSVDIKRASQLLLIVQSGPPMTLIELSFADEDDLDFAFQLPTAPLGDEIFMSRAKRMKRRLNACCKGLLEAQSTKEGQPLPQRTIEYLHRTVRDFVLRQDVVTKLAESTISFNPSLRICLSNLATFKTMNAPDVYSVWNQVVQVVDCITRSGCSQETQTRCLDEVDVAITNIISSFEFRVAHWTELLEEPHCYSFLHFAVRLQLLPYVQAMLNSNPKCLDTPICTRILSSLLETALSPIVSNTLFPWPFAVRRSRALKDVVAFLLEKGADPNALLRRRPASSPKYATIWGALVMESTEVVSTEDKLEVFRIFLEHGADPNQSSLLDHIVGQTMISLVSKKKREWKIRHISKLKKGLGRLIARSTP
jgi:hypothetical protein